MAKLDFMRPGRGTSRALTIAAGLGLMVVGIAALESARRPAPAKALRDSAPGRTSRQRRYGDYAVVGRSVTINRPRQEIYAFWRDFGNLANFMSNIEEVRTEGDLSTWKIAAPGGGTVAVRTRIVSDRPNEEIAWRSVESSEIDTEGKVMFRDAPVGRGTVVEATVAYVPPAGELGRLIAKLFRKEPRIQGRRELKRFKMLMETGEVATSRNRKTA